MAIAKLERSAWQPYFDSVSKHLGSKQAEIEIGALDLGNQIEADWLALYGIVYDPGSDVVEIVLEGLDHLIHRPEQIWVDHDMLGLSSVEIIDRDGMRQIVRLRDPLLLAPPHGIGVQAAAR